MRLPNIESLPSAVRETIADFLESDPLGEAAALSFYTLLSLVPSLLIVVGIAGLAWGDEAATGQLARQLQWVVSSEAAGVIQGVVANAGRSPGGPTAVAIGVVMLLFGATGAIVRLKTALNRIWRVPVAQRRGMVWGFLHARLLSLGLVLAAGLLLVACLAAGAAMTAARRQLDAAFPGRTALWHWDGLLMTWLATALLVGLIYRLLPDTRVPWRSVIAGALTTTTCFAVGRLLVGLYVRHAAIGSAFGAAGSLVVLLVWIYCSSLSVLLGAGVAKVWTRAAGRGVAPEPLTPLSRDA